MNDKFHRFVLSTNSSELSERIGKRFYDDLRDEERHYRGADGILSDRFATEGIEIVDAVKRQISTPSRYRNNLESRSPTRFTFTPFKEVLIEKDVAGEFRPLAVASLRNIVAQTLISDFILEDLDAMFLDSSYAYRVGKSAKQAVKNVYTEVQRGYRWVLDADIRKFFDNVDHDVLLSAFQGRFASEPILNHLIYRYLKTGTISREAVRAERKIRSASSGYVARTKGIPQGGILSGILANLYLHPMDLLIQQHFPKSVYVRYADDFVILGKTKAEIERAKRLIDKFLRDNLGLSLHPDKTRIVDLYATKYSGAKSFVEFLGYKIERDRLAIKRANIVKLKRRIQKIIRDWIDTEELPADLIWRINTRIEGFAWQENDDGSQEFLGRNWLRYFSNITNPGQLKELDEWVIRALKDGIRRKRGQSISKQEVRDLGLISLVNWHFKMIRLSRRSSEHPTQLFDEA